MKQDSQSFMLNMNINCYRGFAYSLRHLELPTRGIVFFASAVIVEYLLYFLLKIFFFHCECTTGNTASLFLKRWWAEVGSHADSRAAENEMNARSDHFSA